MLMLVTMLLLACKAPEEPRVGDPDAGLQTLLYGDFVGAGVPKDIWFDLVPPLSANVLGREGDAAGLPSGFNLFTAPNGIEVVGGITCMGCHAGNVNGEYMMGLGNSHSDYVDPNTSQFDLIDTAVANRYGDDSPEYEAWLPLYRGSLAVSPHMDTPFYGVNPAFSIERAAVAWRNPQTLEWRNQPIYTPPERVMASDVPAWWQVKKKSRLYYTGAGQGDRARLITQISTVAIVDAQQYAAIEESMVDVLAWIDALEPPPYPGDIDASLAEQGLAVFEATCSECHGTYGDDWTYPDRLLPVQEVGTDPLYAQDFADPEGFQAWLQDSWMATTKPYQAEFAPEVGYVAPPLDGVWATGPYLHNGSVPDIASLLDSGTRPAAWSRDFERSDYDLDRLGPVWQAAEPGPPEVYDTSVPSYGNGGHTYGDALDTGERGAVIEYLKTL